MLRMQMLASHPGWLLVLPAPMIPRDAKKLLGSYYGSTRQRVDLPRLLDLYRTGQLKLDELIVVLSWRPTLLSVGGNECRTEGANSFWFFSGFFALFY